MTNIQQSFFSGEYLELVQNHVDGGSLERFTEMERAYLIGALVFVGRRTDAKAEFAAHMKSGIRY